MKVQSFPVGSGNISLAVYPYIPYDEGLRKCTDVPSLLSTVRYLNGTHALAPFTNMPICTKHNRFQLPTLQRKLAVLGIRDILVWIRIPGSVPLTNGSGCGSGRTKSIPILRTGSRSGCGFGTLVHLHYSYKTVEIKVSLTIFA
jgi:hypothetical protein